MNIDIRDIITVKLVKHKNKKNLLSFIGLSKKNLDRNYLAFFDEHFIYFIKDIEINKDNKDLRKIGNKYNIRLLQNTIIDVSNDNIYVFFIFYFF